ncbi:ATP-grasp fold amidoligase family protein [Flavobacterium sp. H122]|uniref:ATP-grasp fold amidoligase family protein n=1 Tax=Flavobacterium sp. H122 TaxID=2529860 RepID=UPI0010AA4698|nr:ATP-grasp fold amidoligase family protein [Flavobacterium sp. H122]
MIKFLKRKALQLYVGLLKLTGANDVAVSKAKYYLKNNKPLNLGAPEEFMEKLQWLKLYHYKEEFARYVDKYEVRKFVEERVGEKYLNKIIGVYNNVEDLNYNDFPNQFVLKCTHGSGLNVIVTEKEGFNVKKTNNLLNKYLKEDYSKENQEAIYKGVKPRIIAEYYLSELGEENIIDYKFFCFSGVVKSVWVKTFDKGLYKNCYYDLDWNKINEDEKRNNFLDVDVKKPENFEEMIEVAHQLSKDFLFMRVDLYSIQNKTYFGELTFFPWGGKQRLTVEKFNKEYARLIELPVKNYA